MIPRAMHFEKQERRINLKHISEREYMLYKSYIPGRPIPTTVEPVIEVLPDGEIRASVRPSQSITVPTAYPQDQ